MVELILTAYNLVSSGVLVSAESSYRLFLRYTADIRHPNQVQVIVHIYSKLGYNLLDIHPQITLDITNQRFSLFLNLLILQAIEIMLLLLCQFFAHNLQGLHIVFTHNQVLTAFLFYIAYLTASPLINILRTRLMTITT